MKKLYVLLAVFALFACKKNTEPSINYSKEALDVSTSVYPENISKVFKAHGGFDQWSEMKSLVFTMEKESGDEVTTTDLRNRKSLIKMPKHIIGFNGKDVWLKQKDTTQYKGKPRFYYNLMFYFYAMPFILGDDGIIYEDVKGLTFNGTTYPGIKIAYEAGVGESPEDEYILYYHPETYQMEWLAYTVTFFTNEKGKEFHFIKYSAWQEVDGLLLPETLTWYNYENNLPTTKRSDLKFIDIVLSKDKPNQELFEIADGAKIVK